MLNSINSAVMSTIGPMWGSNVVSAQHASGPGVPNVKITVVT